MQTEAEKLLRRCLANNPTHSGANQYLARILAQDKRRKYSAADYYNKGGWVRSQEHATAKRLLLVRLCCYLLLLTTTTTDDLYDGLSCCSTTVALWL